MVRNGARLPVAAVLGAVLVLASACVVAAHPAPPPPPPRIVAPQEAVTIATQYARSRGVVVDYTNAARLDRRARWHVDLGGAGGRDRAVVVLDGYSGRILHARLRASGRDFVPPGASPPPPPAEGEPAPPPQDQGSAAAPPPGSGPPSSAPPPPPGPPPPPPAQ